VAFFHLRRLLHLRLRLLLYEDAFADNSSTSAGRHGRQAAIKTIRRDMSGDCIFD
jgi:hypothetical protein